MPEPTVTTALTPSEWRLVMAVRDLPESPVRGHITEILENILFYVRNPRCSGMGVDGFPCGEPASTCEECHQIWDLLDSIAARVALAKI